MCLLVEEAGLRGVLDCGCSKSVAGLKWIGKYSKAIYADFSDQHELTPSSEVYQFGGGEKRESKGSVSIPTLVIYYDGYITMDIVDASNPLLIGTNSLKAGDVVRSRLQNCFFGEVVPIVEVGSGHFASN